MRSILAFGAALLALAPPLLRGAPITPSTTLAIESGNNTSTAGSFTAQSNGNAGPANVSKVSLRNLLYPGATTKIYAHFMAWFGGANHMNVGYSSADPGQVKRQVDDMMSRGVQGAIMDWYGPGFATENTTSKLMMQEAETRGGQFEFAIMEDGGQLKSCANTPGCDVTQQVINDLNYALTTFEGSPAYMRWNGRPVIFFFDGTSYPVDWNRVSANVSGSPLFIFRNAGGFTHAQSNGGFSWVVPLADPANMDTSYLDNFYNTALGFPAALTAGSPYKGFNDTLAAWTQNRVMDQHCGQTWLTTMTEAGKYYSASNQLAAMQLVTWNDYEEGTEIESGIDNCVAVSASISGGATLGWSITGQESTIDHYTIFISTDGQNLMPLGDVPAGTHTLNLAAFALDAGNYTLYVKAIGKPSLVNHLSGAVTYSINPAPLPPVAKLSVSPGQGIAPVSVTASTAGSSAPVGSIVSTSIDFGDGIVLAVSAGGAASHVYNNAGSYVVSATIKDNLGATSSASAAASVAATPSVTITTNGHKAGFILPVSVVVQGYSSNAIVQMRLSLDGKLVAQCQTSYLRTTLHLRTRNGTHSLSATAVDSTGTNFSAMVSWPGP